MKLTSRILKLAMCMAICAAATACNDNDDVVDNNRTDLYEGQLTQRYRDASTGEIKESAPIMVLVQTTKDGPDRIICSTYRQSRYHYRWYIGEQPIYTNTFSFVPSQTVLASTDGAHLREKQLVYRYTLPAGTYDKDGNEIINIGFWGLKVVKTDIHKEIEPLGEYAGNMYSYTVNCPDEKSFNEAKATDQFEWPNTGTPTKLIVTREKNKLDISAYHPDSPIDKDYRWDNWNSTYETTNYDRLICGKAVFDLEGNLEIIKISPVKFDAIKDEQPENYGAVTYTRYTAAKKTAYTEPD